MTAAGTATQVLSNPSAAAGLALSAAFALVGPALFARSWRRRTGAPWSAFGFGAAIFFVSQVLLRFPWQIPLGRWVQRHGGDRPAVQLAFLVFSAFTAGLFEEVGRYLGYRKLLAERSVRTGVMFGLGHGGLESFLLVGVSLVGLLVAWALAAAGKLPPGPALDAIAAQTSGLTFGLGLLAGLERASAVCIQVALSLIVLQAFARGSRRWVAAAIAVHLVADTVGPWSAKVLGPARGEVVIAALALATLWLALRLARPGAPSLSVKAG